MGTFLVILVVVVVVWVVLSLKVVKSDEVALKRYFGKIANEERHKSGLIFLPFFPGIDLVRIPTRQMPYRFEGKLEHRVWSSGHQPLMVDISGYVRFPYDQTSSLKLMVQAGVPLKEEALQTWIEEEVISGARKIMANHTLEEAIGPANLSAVSREAQRFFLRKDGLFAKSGICGDDRLNFTPGTGEVIVRVEQISTTPEMQEALQAEKTSEYLGKAAKATAARNAEEIGAQVLGIVAQLSGKTLQEVQEDIRLHPGKRGQPVEQGGYAEAFAYATRIVMLERSPGFVREEIDFTSAGQPLPAGVQVISVGSGGGGVGVLAGGGNLGGRGSRNNRGGNQAGGARKSDSNSGDANDEDKDRTVAERTFQRFGRYPTWWDPATGKRRPGSGK